jgi:hypothetical protein
MTPLPEGRVEAVLDRYRRDCVLLQELYPPNEGPRPNSKFGGLPNLAARFDWPRSSGGTALHFLAQVDCSEISFASELPGSGMLYFFGRDDDDQAWDLEPPASDYCRVIYDPSAGPAPPPREAPADLGPVGGPYGHPAWRDLLLAGEAGPNLHPEWPLRPLRMDSWPDYSGLPPDVEQDDPVRSGLPAGPRPRTEAEAHLEKWLAAMGPRLEGPPDFFDIYQQRVAVKRVLAFTAATGIEIDYEFDRSTRDREIGAAIFADPSWPRHRIYIDYAARAAIRRPVDYYVHEVASEEEIAAQAAHWLRRSSGRPPDEAVPDEERREFRHWIAGLCHPDSPWSFGPSAARLVIVSSTAAIRSWSSDPIRAAKIPATVYGPLSAFFTGCSIWGDGFSQMLGHAQSAQEARPVGDPTVCLISLASQSATGWMFGDVGEATFWIAPEDLAAREFDRAWATVEGH